MQKALDMISGISGTSPLDISKDWMIYKQIHQKQESENSYARSYGYLAQATRGTPYKYYDPKNLLTFAFNRDGRDVVALDPVGQNAVSILHEVAKLLSAQGVVLHVKKINDVQRNAYIAKGFVDVNYGTDFYKSELPDDVFPEVSIDVMHFDRRATGKIMRDLRNRMKQLISKNIVFNVSHELSAEICEELRCFLRKWADIKRERDSCYKVTDLVQAYIPILSIRKILQDPINIVARDGNTREIVGWSLAERQFNSDAYTCVSNLNLTSYHGLSESMIVCMLDAMKERAIPTMNVGGSEFETLHKHKVQFTPVSTKRMHYLKWANPN